MSDLQDKTISEEEAAENTMDREDFIEFLYTYASIVLATAVLGALIFGVFYIVRNRPADPVPLVDIEEVTTVTAYRDFGEQGVLSPNFDGAAFEFSLEEEDSEVALEENIFKDIEDPQLDAVRLFGLDLQDRGLCWFLDVTPEQPGSAVLQDEETGLTQFPPIIHESQRDYPDGGQEICNQLADLARKAGFIG